MKVSRALSSSVSLLLLHALAQSSSFAVALPPRIAPLSRNSGAEFLAKKRGGNRKGRGCGPMQKASKRPKRR
jgi:hypothetical protein